MDSLAILLNRGFLPVLVCLAGIAAASSILTPDRKGTDFHWPEFLALCLALSLSLYGIVVLILASFGALTVAHCNIVLFILSAAALVYCRICRLHLLPLFTAGGKRHAVALCAVVLLSLVYLCPGESIMDGRDNGMYAFSAAALVEQKANVWRWDNLLDLQQGNGTRGLFITPPFLMPHYSSPFNVVNDGYDYYPALLTLGYFTGGMGGIKYIYTAIAILNLFLIFYASLRFFEGDLTTAVLCVFFYAINMAVLFTARMGLTEAASSLFLTAIILIMLKENTHRARTAIALYLLLSAALLTHPANYLFLVPLAALCGSPGWFPARKSYFANAFAILAAVITGIAYSLWRESEYYLMLRNYILTMVAIAGGIFAYQGFRSRRRESRIGRQVLSGHGNRLFYAGAFLLMAIAAYAYYVRPQYDILQSLVKGIGVNSEGSRWTFRRFGYYMTAVGIFGSLAGLLVWRSNGKGMLDRARMAAVACIGLFSAAFLFTTTTHDFHFFTARRYVVVIVWGFLLFLSYAIVSLYRKRLFVLRCVAVGMAAVYIGNAVYVMAPFLFFEEEKGANRDIQELAGDIGNGVPVLENDRFGVILRFVFHKNVIPYSELSPGFLKRVTEYYANKGIDRIFLLKSSQDGEATPLYQRYVFKQLKEYKFPLPGSVQVRESVPHGKVLHMFRLALYELPTAAGAQERSEFNLKDAGVWKGLYGDGWTEGVFGVAVPSDIMVACSVLSVRLVRPARLAGMRDDSLRISVNGTIIETLHCNMRCGGEIAIPKNLSMRSGGEQMSITFSSASGIVPKDYGINADSRSLHFAIEECILMKCNSKLGVPNPRPGARQ